MADLDLSIDGLHALEVLGVGGFATVYRARDARLEDDVAVKVLAENHSMDPDIRERFIREAQVLRRVAGDHVIRLHDVGETDRSQPYMVLEYARNGDLAERVRRRNQSGTPPTPGDVRQLVAALRSALGSLHGAGLVHRDISPRNLLLCPAAGRGAAGRGVDGVAGHLDPGERLVLADLGFVKDLARSSGLTVGGGTSGFSAPEQAQPSARIDHRADIYGASAVVAWLILGQPPAAIGTDLARRLALAGFPEALGPALARGMATDPAQRHDSIDAWADEIERVLYPAPAPTPEPAATPEPSPAGSGQPRRELLLAGGAVAGLALAGLIWLATSLLGGGPGSTTLDDGTVRVAESAGEVTVAIVGPDEIVVGESVTYRAELEGAESSVWLAPDGRLHADVDSMTINAGSPGSLRIGLVAVDGSGSPLVVRREVTAVAAADSDSG